MVFFLELLVDFYEFDTIGELFERIRQEGLKPLIEDDAFDNTINLLRKLVMTGASKSPLKNIHYHTAFFSRRWFSKMNQYPDDDPRLPDIEKSMDRFRFAVYKLPTCKKKEKEFGVSCLEFYSLGVIKGALAPETAWMFVSELASSRTDSKRFENRRGLPILRENWVVPRDNPQRKKDLEIIDEILDNKRFFCNFWIGKYWNIESDLQLKKLLGEIFIGIGKPSNVDAKNEEIINVDIKNEEIENIRPTIDELRKKFLNILKDIEKN